MELAEEEEGFQVQKGVSRDLRLDPEVVAQAHVAGLEEVHQGGRVEDLACAGSVQLAP